MRRMIATLALIGVVMSGSAFAGPDEYDDSQSHPLRVAAYLAHPIGYAMEWAIFRPFHWLVSRENTEEVFGHVPHGSETEMYGAQEPR